MGKVITCENCGNPIEGDMHHLAADDMYVCDDCHEGILNDEARDEEMDRDWSETSFLSARSNL